MDKVVCEWVHEKRHKYLKNMFNDKNIPKWEDAIENIDRNKHNMKVLNNFGFKTLNANYFECSKIILSDLEKIDSNADSHAYISLLSNSNTFGKHRDIENVIFLMCTGKVQFIVWDPEKITYILERGDVLFIPSGMWHETVTFEPRFGISYGFVCT